MSIVNLNRLILNHWAVWVNFESRQNLLGGCMLHHINWSTETVWSLFCARSWKWHDVNMNWIPLSYACQNMNECSWHSLRIRIRTCSLASSTWSWYWRHQIKNNYSIWRNVKSSLLTSQHACRMYHNIFLV